MAKETGAAHAINLYFLAGVGTAPRFMETFQHEMVRRYEKTGCQVQSNCLYPYGDWSRRLLPQIIETRHDVWLGKNSSIGGQAIVNAINESYLGGRIVLIGHSGGGVAAVQVASILGVNDGIHVSHVVQIGSPKCKVPFKQRDSVLYLYAANAKGRSIDPIVRIGSWAGWSRIRGMPRWNRRLYAPTAIKPISIIGGHRDYFRDHSSFRNADGKSNLEVTSDSVWDWLEKN
jgi:hypothetical protein